MKIATVAVVLPSICKGVKKYSGILNLAKDKKTPKSMERIKGLRESFFTTVFMLALTEVFPKQYNSKTVIDTGTLTRDIVDADKVAKDSPSPGKANIIKGIPKNTRLPKTVLKTTR